MSISRRTEVTGAAKHPLPCVVHCLQNVTARSQATRAHHYGYCLTRTSRGQWRSIRRFLPGTNISGKRDDLKVNTPARSGSSQSRSLGTNGVLSCLGSHDVMSYRIPHQIGGTSCTEHFHHPILVKSHRSGRHVQDICYLFHDLSFC